ERSPVRSLPADSRGHDGRGHARAAQRRDGTAGPQGSARAAHSLRGFDRTGRQRRSRRGGREGLLGEADVKIGRIDLPQPFALAPMAGMTDTAFRRLVKRRGGCGLVVSEMVSSEGLVRGIDRTLEYAEYTEEERPVSI